MGQFQDDGSAYMQLAGTRPNTIAQLLADSPAGQLGWIAEKYKEWTDQAHRLPEQAIGRDTILTTAIRVTGHARAGSVAAIQEPAASAVSGLTTESEIRKPRASCSTIRLRAA